MQKIPSSALGYAITFLLLVGLVCTGLLFVAGVNKRIEVNYSLEEHLVFDNLFALNLGAQSKENKQFLLPHVNGDTSKITIKNWGAYRVVVANTFHTNKSLIKTALIGNTSFYTYSTIFLPDQRQTLKVCGETRIYGNVLTSERGLERGYIAGKNYSGDKLVYGELQRSEKYLPELSPDFKNLSLESFISETEKIDFPQKDTIFSFENKTSLVTGIEPLVIAHRIEGNVILHSFESITVSSDAYLENVILIAPKVFFEEGFKGAVQVVAHEQVVLEKNVTLVYPSTISINEITENNNREPRGIILEEGSMIVGGVLLVSQKPDFRNPLKLEMNDAVIGGLIYNTGETQIKGKVHGYIYTAGFTLKAGGGEYKNHLLDAEISSIALPKEFILPQWIKHDEKTKGEIIAWF